MADRILAWMSAGVLTAGLCAATLAGAGMAAADDGGGANATTSSQSTAPSGQETEVDADQPGASPDPGDATDATGTEVDAEEPAEEPADEEAAEEPEDVAEEVEAVDDETGAGPDHDGADGAEELEATAGSVDSPAPVDEAPDTAPAAADTTQAAGDAVSSLNPEPAVEPVAMEPAVQAITAEAAATVDAQSSPASARLMMTAPEEEAPAPWPSLLNVVGSFFWGLFDLAVRLIDFPPTVPPGSTVTAGRSKLEIDCGDGYTADADWYYPTEGEPDKFIYFQHGFLARANFFNVTLQELAERNNAVVVAPSITSNIFACDACAMSGSPMQAAVARLFKGNRAALLASARAAGYEGVLPEQFVITGQSAGANLAAGASGYYYQLAPVSERADLAGVILYEISAVGGELGRALDTLPDSVPVLTVAAAPNMLNSRGSANPVFAEKRPGQFVGIQLVGGAHSDAFQSNVLFGIPQVIVRLVFGASTAENIEAVHVLTTGWLTDMYAGRVYKPATRTGIYGTTGDAGEVVDIPVDGAVARGYVLPVPRPALSPFDRLSETIFGLIDADLYARCAVAPEQSATGDLACAV